MGGKGSGTTTRRAGTLPGIDRQGDFVPTSQERGIVLGRLGAYYLLETREYRLTEPIGGRNLQTTIQVITQKYHRMQEDSLSLSRKETLAEGLRLDPGYVRAGLQEMLRITSRNLEVLRKIRLKELNGGS